MAAAVITKAKPVGVTGYNSGNKKIRYLKVTSNTGDYAAGGFDIDASDFGLRHLDFVSLNSGIATQGTNGASGVGIGITMASDRTSLTVQLYEVDTAADGAPFQEKGAEAMVANFVFELRAEGY